jgi:DNA-binding transcriptional LysR family regulator
MRSQAPAFAGEGDGAIRKNWGPFCYFSTVNWDDLRFLLAVTRASTLSEAALALGVTQTTVTRRLTALEEQVGARLVVRTSHGIVVTDTGRTVARAAAEVEGRLATLDQQITARDDALEGPLRIATIDMVAHYDAELFASFRARYPGVDVTVFTGYERRNLGRDAADIAIRWTNDPPETLVGRRMGTASFALHAGRQLVERIGEDVSLADVSLADLPLADLPWLGWIPAMRAEITEAWMRQHVPDARIVARYDSAIALHAAIRAGLGVAFMPCAYAAQDPTLVRLRPPERGFDYDVWLLLHAQARYAARVRAFADHAASYFGPRFQP